MEERETVEALLTSLAEKTGIGPLDLDDSGVCQLEYDEDLRLFVEHPSGSPLLFLHSPVCSLSADSGAAFLRRLLAMNFLMLETRGCTLAVDERANTVSLCYGGFIDGLEADTLYSLLGNFVEAALAVRDKLSSEHDLSEASPSIESVDPTQRV